MLDQEGKGHGNRLHDHNPDRDARTVITGKAGLPVECGGFDAIVAQVPAGFGCRASIPAVDSLDAWRRGDVALWLGEAGFIVESANESRGARPWVPQPQARPQLAGTSAIEK